MSNFWNFGVTGASVDTSALKLSTRALQEAIDDALMSYTREKLELILVGDLELKWTHDSPPTEAATKRAGVSRSSQDSHDEW